MSPEKKYLTLEQVADLLGVHYQLVYRLARSGELPASRIGRVYRVAQADLDAYLEKSKPSASTAGVCSACGKSYASKLSLSEECRECGAAICTDCWSRKDIRYCKKHGKK